VEHGIEEGFLRYFDPVAIGKLQEGNLMSSGWCDRCINSECRNCGSLKPDPTPEELREERKELCEKLRDRDAAILGLRRRVHFIERHIEEFEKCESLWCNPVLGNNPAISFHITHHDDHAEISSIDADMVKAIGERDGAD
jgi:hypothetical protein